jgi:hypothetical protein
MNPPSLIITGVALVGCVVNLACFGNRPAWRSAANAFTGTLGATGAAAGRIWWLIPVWLVLTAWGLLGLANAKGALNDRGPEKGKEEGRKGKS